MFTIIIILSLIGIYTIDLLEPTKTIKPKYIKPLRKIEQTDTDLLLELSQKDSILHQSGSCCQISSLPFEPDEPAPKETNASR